MSITVLLSFLLFTGFVVAFTYNKVKNDKNTSQDGFFLGGRSLTGGLIASSLILTNLSATSFVGSRTVKGSNDGERSRPSVSSTQTANATHAKAVKM